MRLPKYAASAAVAFLAVSTHSVAASPPAAPQVTMGADLKLLRFDWEPVAGADFYRLWIKPGGSRYISVGERIPASITQAEHVIPVHLQHWVNTRYVVTACNSAGCTHSAALNPRNLMLDTIGYLKASNADPDDQFGREVALSSDGLTLAVSAEHESSAATGVNGDQADNSSAHSGAVYIFRRTGAGWRQDAYLKPGVNFPGIRFGVGVPKLNQRAIALNGNGTVAAIGAPAHDTGALGMSGEVYVFRRRSNGWTLAATLRAPERSEADFFGVSVDISLDGRTIKVSGLNPRDSEGQPQGRTYIFGRTGETWAHLTTIGPLLADFRCPNVRMAGNGRKMVSICRFPDNTTHALTLMRPVPNGGTRWVEGSDPVGLATFSDDLALALNDEASMMAVLQGGTEWSVDIYRNEAFVWSHEARLVAPAGLDRYNAFGFSLAFSSDGNRLAIGDYFSSAAGAGVSPGAVNGTTQHGAVFVYERIIGDTYSWKLISAVKAPHPGVDAFGLSVALSGSGRTLAVGAMQEDSNARGIDGDQLDESSPQAGAAYLY